MGSLSIRLRWVEVVPRLQRLRSSAQLGGCALRASRQEDPKPRTACAGEGECCRSPMRCCRKTSSQHLQHPKRLRSAEPTVGPVATPMAPCSARKHSNSAPMLPPFGRARFRSRLFFMASIYRHTSLQNGLAWMQGFRLVASQSGLS